MSDENDPLNTAAHHDPSLTKISSFATHLEDDMSYADADFTPRAILDVTQTIEKHNIWLFSEADMGHLIPILFVGAALAERGHEVTFVSTQGIFKKIEGKLQAGGMKFLGLDAPHIEHTEIPGDKELQPSFVQRWGRNTPLLKALAAAHKPDFMLVDFTSFAGIDVCIELDIPYVMNLPGPVAIAVDLQALDSWWVQQVVAIAAGTHMAKTATAIQARMKRSVVLVHSFWGIDKPCMLPPNIMACGPCFPRFSGAPPEGTTLEVTFGDNEELCAFLVKAREAEADLVYITMGSLAKLNKKEVEALYKGAISATSSGKKAWVIWSMKGASRDFLDQLIIADRPDFDPKDKQDLGNLFVSGWLPQIDILNYESTKAVVTHCGWGGTMEVISAQKPILTHPFFGDQPANAALLKSAGVAINLNVTGGYSAADVQAGLTNLMTDNSYRNKAKYIKKLLDASPGTKMAVDVIEWIAGHPEAVGALTVGMPGLGK